MTSKNRKSISDAMPGRDEITPELIDYYVRYGAHLRAAMVAAWLGGIGARIARLWRPAPPAPRESMAERFANSLAAIRSSAETLRDERDLSPAERARFVSVVLEEEARLEALLRQLPREGGVIGPGAVTR